MSGYAVVRVADSEEDVEAFGPFSNRVTADRFREEYEEWVCPGYSYLTVELYGVREGRRMIRDEKGDES